MSSLVDRWHTLPPSLRGILWVGISGFMFALLNVFTLIPSRHLNPFVMAFMRYLFGTMFLVPIVLPNIAFIEGQRYARVWSCDRSALKWIKC